MIKELSSVNPFMMKWNAIEAEQISDIYGIEITFLMFPFHLLQGIVIYPCLFF